MTHGENLRAGAIPAPSPKATDRFTIDASHCIANLRP
jgi:hypothetical protein